MAKRKTVKVDRLAECEMRCSSCGKEMPKGTEVYLVKPTDWRAAWASYISVCRECAEKAGV